MTFYILIIGLCHLSVLSMYIYLFIGVKFNPQVYATIYNYMFPFYA